MGTKCDSCGVELEGRDAMDPDDKMRLEEILGDIQVFCTECERRECGPWG
ncbi:MAG: hypothetical protein KAW93_07995 [Methanogenium sp.]|nr:hypothetical protein [Methanogenium sp.]